MRIALIRLRSTQVVHAVDRAIDDSRVDQADQISLFSGTWYIGLCKTSKSDSRV